jgi:hypothetical protein
MEQATPHTLDILEPVTSGYLHAEFGEEETQPWDAAWIDIGGEG